MLLYCKICYNNKATIDKRLCYKLLNINDLNYFIAFLILESQRFKASVKN